MGAVSKAKHVISISLGASSRDAKAAVTLGDTEIIVERCGTDGDFQKARQLLEYWDGKADAIGLGGTDLYVYAGKQRYTFRESAKLIANVQKTPVLDGSGLKNSLERRLIQKLAQENIVELKNKKVLLVCGVDRFGMAEALIDVGAQVTLGDIIYGLNINKPLYSLKSLELWAKILAPVITRLPVKMFYPMGAEQNKRTPRHTEYFLQNDIIAGDFHFIKKFMPDTLPDKFIITNTVTAADREMLRRAGVRMLITTTPCLSGRSFGTNVMEAMLVALKGTGQALSAAEYIELLDKYEIESSVEYISTREQ